MQLWAWILLYVSLFRPWNKWIRGEQSELVWFHFEPVHTINANIANNIIPTPLYTPQHTLSTLKYIKFNKIIALWPGLNFICTLSATRFRFYSKYTHFYLIKSTVQVWQYSQATTFAYLNWIVHLTRMKVRTTAKHAHLVLLFFMTFFASKIKMLYVKPG